MDPISKRAPSKKVDYYGSYLEALRQAPPDEQELTNEVAAGEEPATVVEPSPDVVAVGDDVAEESASAEAAVNPVDVLVVLRDSGPLEMAKLQAMTNLSFTRFAGVMAKLDEAGLVKISGTPGAESVEILPAGVTLASLG
jgi:hypothetical protein